MKTLILRLLGWLLALVSLLWILSGGLVLFEPAGLSYALATFGCCAAGLVMIYRAENKPS